MREGVSRLGLVTPYLDQIQAKIMENYAGLGVQCVAERHLDDPGNFSFSEIGSDTIAEMVRDVAKASPQEIAIVCTNLRAAPLVDALERETGILILDSIAVVVWTSLRLAGLDPRRVQAWGRLFLTTRLKPVRDRSGQERGRRPQAKKPDRPGLFGNGSNDFISVVTGAKPAPFPGLSSRVTRFYARRPC